MNPSRTADQVFLYLGAIFLAALVACNLIFRKFFVWELPALAVLGLEPRMELSVGILAYPVTFICTDVLSEFFGRRRVGQLVTAGLAASVFVGILVLVSEAVPATEWSRVDDAMFTEVFGLQSVALIASMGAYLGAQYLDIRMFHFWKRVTRGRHLWFRNNASTFVSQLVDTILVSTLLAVFGVQELTWDRLPQLVANGVAFKWMVAIADTPLIYLVVWFIRSRLGIAPSDPEIERSDRRRRLAHS